MANAVVYLLTVTVFTGQWMIDVSAFDPNNVGARWWTFVSYMFLHGGLMHLLMNLLLLFVFGPAVEKRMGGRTFATYYFTCGIGGAAFWLLISMLGATLGPMIGASAAVLGVALAFAMFWPNEPIHVFPLPMPIKVKWLVAFLVVMDLLAARSGAQDGVAHFAHLGGFLFGYIFLKSQQNLWSEPLVVRARERQMQNPVRRRPKEPVAAAQQKSREEQQGFDKYDEVDRVLDKISESGLESLTAEERKLLDEASRQLRKH